MVRKPVLSVRKTMAFVVAMGLAGLATGCAGGGSNNQPEDGPVEIRFSWGATHQGPS